VLFVSSEIPEFVRLCARVITFYQGRGCSELRGDALTDHRLLEAINTDKF